MSDFGAISGGRFLSSTHLNANATTAINANPGFLHTITINTAGAAANTITVYDHPSGVGNVLAVIDSVAVGKTTYVFDCKFLLGLTIVIATGTAADITVTWR